MSRIWCNSNDTAVIRKEILDGPETTMLVINIGRNEQSESVLAFAYALQHSNKKSANP